MDAGAYGNWRHGQAEPPQPVTNGEADLGWYSHRAGSNAQTTQAQRPGDAAKRPGQEAADRLHRSL